METRTDLDTLAAWVRDRQEQMQGAIRELAGIESPSDDAPAVNRAVAWVQARGTAIGGEAKLHRNLQDSGIKYGHVLELKFHPRDPIESQKPVLLLGHLDTVWAEGTLASMPIRTENGRMFGPGVYDMKAGVVMALTAVQALIETSLLNQPVSLLLVSDEEVGSPVSRPITEKVAGQASAVFVVEPAQGPQGAYKTARKGVGGYRLEVRGIGAHSGVDFTAGHSAVLELARQIEVISGFTDLDSGLTVNPGVIGGGTRSNVVAESAWVEIDVRVARTADVEGIERKLRGLRPFDEKCVLTLTGGLNRPPMERTKGTAALFERAATLAGYMGCKLEEAATGGGSDGNFTSALGIPTLDGMGAVGEGAHASNESILIDALVPRTALLAAMLLNDMGLR